MNLLKKHLMRWVAQWIGLSIVIDLAFIMAWGWQNFLKVEYWKSLPMALIIMIPWIYIDLSLRKDLKEGATE